MGDVSRGNTRVVAQNERPDQLSSYKFLCGMNVDARTPCVYSGKEYDVYINDYFARKEDATS